MTGPVSKKLFDLATALFQRVAEREMLSIEETEQVAGAIDAMAPIVEAMEWQPVPHVFRVVEGNRRI